MKLGVSYNVFDGEELLEDSIKSIRNNVDYISVVYQDISNFGNSCSEELLPILEKLESEKLIDELFHYRPKVDKGGHYNEIRKRNIGLSLSEGAGCTHHMAMDTDELYTDEQFRFMKKVIEEGDYNSSACQLQTYYKSWEYRLDPPEDYYVSLIYKITPNREYVFGCGFPVLVDPTRRMEPGKCKIFTRDEVEMHHGSYIRNNLISKLQNSSSKAYNWDIDKVVDYFDKWSYPKKGLMIKPTEEYVKLKKVKNLFV